MGSIDIRVLGPIRVSVDEEPIPLRGRTERALLATLVITLNHAAAAEQLILALWGDAPPPSARNTLQSCVSRLRAKLGGAIVSEGHAYRLDVCPDCIDAVRFERLVVAAAGSLEEDPSGSCELTREALGLWHGRPFADLPETDLVLPEITRLEELRLAATELRLEADVALGRFAQVIPRMRAELAEQPYRERIWYLLILALARDGRRVEALRCYDELWELMSDVGLEPSEPLRRLQSAIIDEQPDVRLRITRALRTGVTEQ